MLESLGKIPNPNGKKPEGNLRTLGSAFLGKCRASVGEKTLQNIGKALGRK